MSTHGRHPHIKANLSPDIPGLVIICHHFPKTVKAMADGPCMDDNHDDLPPKMMVMLHGCAKEHPKKHPSR